MPYSAGSWVAESSLSRVREFCLSIPAFHDDICLQCNQRRANELPSRSSPSCLDFVLWQLAHAVGDLKEVLDHQRAIDSAGTVSTFFFWHDSLPDGGGGHCWNAPPSWTSRIFLNGGCCLTPDEPASLGKQMQNPAEALTHREAWSADLGEVCKAWPDLWRNIGPQGLANSQAHVFQSLRFQFSSMQSAVRASIFSVFMAFKCGNLFCRATMFPENMVALTSLVL